MLWTFSVLLVAVWLVAVANSYTLGGFIHVLLLAVIVTTLVGVIRGRKVIS